METGYLFALTTGLLGGFGHCIGMCGPIVASCSLVVQPAKPAMQLSMMMPHLLYNAGRIATYSVIGGLMGLTGSFVNIAGRLAGIQNAVALLAGVIMIVMGMSITGMFRATGWIERHSMTILRHARDVLVSSSPLRFGMLGLLLGSLPCGLSYTVFIAAAGTGGPVPGMITSLLFGLGTLPALLLFGALLSTLGARLRGRIYRAGGVLVMAMGLYYVYKGLMLYAGV